MLTLREISRSDGDEYIRFSRRYKAQCGEETINFGLNPSDLPYDVFFEKVSELNCPDNLPEGWVPAKYFLLWKDEAVIGVLSVRYGDSDFVLNYAGHIGYCIAPWERGRGYASEALALLLPYAASLGLERVLITCNPNNEASRRVILRNGGVFERSSEEKEFYWLNLKS